MEQNDNGHYRSQWASFFGGALMGIGLYMFFAPVSGKEARERIYSKISSLKNRCKQLEENRKAAAGKKESVKD